MRIRVAAVRQAKSPVGIERVAHPAVGSHLRAPSVLLCEEGRAAAERLERIPASHSRPDPWEAVTAPGCRRVPSGSPSNSDHGARSKYSMATSLIATAQHAMSQIANKLTAACPTEGPSCRGLIEKDDSPLA
nr:hypothetical protein GCM10020092_104380 [Actinoplanes digitatis]